MPAARAEVLEAEALTPLVALAVICALPEPVDAPLPAPEEDPAVLEAVSPEVELVAADWM